MNCLTLLASAVIAGPDYDICRSYTLKEKTVSSIARRYFKQNYRLN